MRTGKVTSFSLTRKKKIGRLSILKEMQFYEGGKEDRG